MVVCYDDLHPMFLSQGNLWQRIDTAVNSDDEPRILCSNLSDCLLIEAVALFKSVWDIEGNRGVQSGEKIDQ